MLYSAAILLKFSTIFLNFPSISIRFSTIFLNFHRFSFVLRLVDKRVKCWRESKNFSMILIELDDFYRNSCQIIRDWKILYKSKNKGRAGKFFFELLKRENFSEKFIKQIQFKWKENQFSEQFSFLWRVKVKWVKQRQRQRMLCHPFK